ncbi:uncharacterized protein [Physcomitrium patens]|uniref:Remorin C-terminal domain-containing protein n=1 Tax=Physcomitrium patens TaxID=3218 RepID=A0A7I4DQX9_PHYPA|nr:uncharacterized protein LOC112280803 isoform X2 [Physcomitrium patens]|eukprot:XP_024372418.1 uncharacterized protein LOC112280803 isoform X2 [Physcomitrella patens]
MSMRHRATQCLGKISDKPRSRASNPASPLWPGYHVRSHEHEVSQPSSPAPSVASERLSRSRETVKAWLESSPTSVLGDHLVVGSRTSSSHSHVSSPGRPECRACSSPFDRSRSNNILPRARAISPPKCPASRNPQELSRIDTGRYSGGHGSTTPPTFQHSGAFRDDHLHSFTPEECSSPGSEFSLTSEWHNMVAAGNAAGMSTRNSSSNTSDFEISYEGLSGSRVNLSTATSMSRAHPHGARNTSRTQSMELPRLVRSNELSGSGQLKNDKYTVNHQSAPHSADLKRTYTRQSSVNYDISDLHRMSRGDAASMREAFGHVPKQKVHSSSDSKFTSRFDKEERELQSLEEQQRAKTAAALKQVELKLELERARLIEKMNNELAMARRKVEEKKARSAIDTKIMRRPAKSPRGCLFLG